MRPSDLYHQKIAQKEIDIDAGQAEVVAQLDAIWQGLSSEFNKRQVRWKIWQKKQVVQGLYLYGGVGIGKTFLMDCFYATLPFDYKLRMHFHQFMHMVHDKLKQMQGEQDPLKRIAKEIAAKAMVICFDEFFVSDITDAMILTNLLRALFAEGVCLVTTSNIEPDRLYWRGLQRQQFLPSITLIKEHCRVMHLKTSVDYRRRYLKDAGVYHSPLNQQSNQVIDNIFSVLTNQLDYDTQPISICNRQIPVVRVLGDVAWFRFVDLCQPPRSQTDYLALADQYHTVVLSDVPKIAASDRNSIILFIKLIDVFYDAHTRVVISAAAPAEELYTAGPMLFEYQRTCSRLIEMQSEEYYAEHVLLNGFTQDHYE